MINLIETPQRADFKAEYIIAGDKEKDKLLEILAKQAGLI